MSKTSYFQRSYGSATTVQGGGDPYHFEEEAAFIGHYGTQLATTLRAGDLKVALIEDGAQFLAIGYPDGRMGGVGRIQGVVSTLSKDAESVLTEIDWKAC